MISSSVRSGAVSTASGEHRDRNHRRDSRIRMRRCRRSALDSIAEMTEIGVPMIDEQCNRLEAMMENMRREFGVLGEAVENQTAESRRTNTKLDALEARFDELTFEVRGLKADVGKL